jgi:hypothetical protein
MRTMVAPSAMAASRSWDMPMDRVSSGTPAARMDSDSSAQLRKGSALGAGSSAGSGIAIRPRNRSPGRRLTAWQRASASSGAQPLLLASPETLTCTQTCSGGSVGRGAGGKAFGDFQAFDGVHPTEVFGDLAGLVALQRADEMPVQIARSTANGSCRHLPDVILAKSPLSGLGGHKYTASRPGLADRQQGDAPQGASGRPCAALRCVTGRLAGWWRLRS